MRSPLPHLLHATYSSSLTQLSRSLTTFFYTPIAHAPLHHFIFPLASLPHHHHSLLHLLIFATLHLITPPSSLPSSSASRSTASSVIDLLGGAVPSGCRQSSTQSGSFASSRRSSCSYTTPLTILPYAPILSHHFITIPPYLSHQLHHTLITYFPTTTTSISHSPHYHPYHSTPSTRACEFDCCVCPA